MSHCLEKRLLYFARLQNKIDAGAFKFDANKPNFGYKHLDILMEPNPDTIKSYPCVMYHKKANIEYAVKIIPMTKRLRRKGLTHPGEIEVLLLKEFNRMVKYAMSPHLTFYIADYTVPCNARAMRMFPLKRLQKYVEPTCKVLVAEYVNGGSIQDWMHHTTPDLEQWRYIVFSVCWTLMVLQDRYRCIHNDLHYGNVLIDTKYKDDQKPIAYNLVDVEEDLNIQFRVHVPGILPKMWDWEVANTFKDGFRHVNPVALGKSHFPVEFDPHYDLHYFLTTLLEEDIPEELVDLIYSIYTDDFVPSERSKELLDEKFNGSSSTSSMSSTSSTKVSESFNPDEWEVDTSAEESDYDTNPYYDSDDELPVAPAHDDDVCDVNDIALDVSGEEKTEYLMGERMLNGAWKKKKHVPTPLSLLQHEFFACYRQEAAASSALTYRHVREPGMAWRLTDGKYV